MAFSRSSFFFPLRALIWVKNEGGEKPDPNLPTHPSNVGVGGVIFRPKKFGASCQELKNCVWINPQK